MSTIDKQALELKKILNQRLRGSANSSFLATVAAVDESARTCTVTIDDQPYTDVRLYAVENADLKGVCMIPAVGSAVLVSRIGGSNELFVAMFSAIDRVVITTEKVRAVISTDKVEVDCDEIVFNGGDNKGLIKIEKLTTKINELVDSFNKHVHSGVIIGVSGGSGAPAVGAPGNSAVPTAAAAKLNRSDYENEKITH